ncbi:hypothetical protein MCOR25_006035 [Pyricularia grisea]|nr:hypothetical protein MCOR25_006035 [Pyricularia grisea]
MLIMCVQGPSLGPRVDRPFWKFEKYPSYRSLVGQGKEWNANASDAIKEPVLRVFAAVYMRLIVLSSAVTL